LIKEKNLSKNIESEISNHKKLKHPYIIKLYDFFEDNEFVYLVLEYAENNNLYEYVKKKGKLKEKEAFIFFIQACIAIDYMHKREIFHRDIKVKFKIFALKFEIFLL
jgi:serine/threonine protein kinase